MTFVRDAEMDATLGVAMSDAPEGLAAINQPGCAAAIWRRQPLPDFQAWIDALHPLNLPDARMILRPNMVRSAVEEMCEAAALPPSPERETLADDVAALASIFAAQMETQFLRLRLEAVNTNACRRFHIDVLTARLICTYRGAGTQYSLATESGDPERIFSVPTGAPVVLTGTDWPGREKSGLLHRSPPIEATGETRLVLVLDPADDPEGAS